MRDNFFEVMQLDAATVFSGVSNRLSTNFHGSKACSSAQEEKFCFGLSPHEGTPRTRTATAFTGLANRKVKA